MGVGINGGCECESADKSVTAWWWWCVCVYMCVRVCVCACAYACLCVLKSHHLPPSLPHTFPLSIPLSFPESFDMLGSYSVGDNAPEHMDTSSSITVVVRDLTSESRDLPDGGEELLPFPTQMEDVAGNSDVCTH